MRAPELPRQSSLQDRGRCLCPGPPFPLRETAALQSETGRREDPEKTTMERYRAGRLEVCRLFFSLQPGNSGPEPGSPLQGFRTEKSPMRGSAFFLLPLLGDPAIRISEDSETLIMWTIVLRLIPSVCGKAGIL